MLAPETMSAPTAAERVGLMPLTMNDETDSHTAVEVATEGGEKEDEFDPDSLRPLSDAGASEAWRPSRCGFFALLISFLLLLLLFLTVLLVPSEHLALANRTSFFGRPSLFSPATNLSQSDTAFQRSLTRVQEMESRASQLQQQLESMLASLASLTRVDTSRQPDCSAFPRRAPADQLVINAREEARRIRAMNRTGEEHHVYVAELESVLKQHNDNWQMALRAFLMPELDFIGYKARPVSLECTTHAVVIIETRFTNIDFIVRHNFWMLEQDSQQWGLVLFYGKDNGPKLVEAFEIWPGGAGEHIQLHQLKMDLNQNVANQLYVSPDFWELIPVENALFLQGDGLILRPPSTNLTMWYEFTHQYPYVGAPLPHRDNGFGHWGPTPDTPYAGNGGMSFRKKSIMLEFSRTLKCPHPESLIGECHFEPEFPSAPPQWHYEDRYIGWHLWAAQYRFRDQIPFAKARWWAVDVVPADDFDPFLAHKPWQQVQLRIRSREAILTLLAPTKTYYLDQVDRTDQRRNDFRREWQARELTIFQATEAPK